MQARQLPHEQGAGHEPQTEARVAPPRAVPCIAGLMLILVVAGVGCGRPHLDISDEVLATATPEVLARVRVNPYNYFRLVNREWTTRVCEMLAADLPGQPVVQLHGDAHVEQFAYMRDAWGLDDFDDATRGPAAVDIVRFLGSIELVARERGWSHDRDRTFDRFFDGYRQGVADPAYHPPEPDVVRRHRAVTDPTTREGFLASSEELMKPIREARLQGAVASMRAFGEIVRRKHPEYSDGYFSVVRAGALEMGIGSAALPKLLIRLAGPSDDPADDVLLEAKAVRPRGSETCLEQPASTPTPTFRIVQGSEQVGRLKHSILVAGPDVAIAEMAVEGKHVSDWWIRSWDPTYHEIHLDDLQSVADLADLAYDAGVQLGAGAVAADNEALRRQLTASIDQAEPRLRRAAEQLVNELLRGWRRLETRH
jgi:uncharacterized protein (DUF2252 family)